MTINNPFLDKSPTYAMIVNGKPFGEDLAIKLSDWTYDDYEGIDKLTLVFDNSSEDPNDDISNNDLFEYGSIIEFQHGYIGALSDIKTMNVNVVKGWKTITVEAYEVIQYFDTEPHYGIFEDSNIEDMVSVIAKNNKLGYQVQERVDGTGAILLDTYFQSGVEDMAFLYTLGLNIGYSVWIENIGEEKDPVLFFMPRRYDQAPYMDFTYFGLNGQVLDFVPEMTALGRRSSVECGGLDIEEKKAFYLTTKEGVTEKVLYEKVDIKAGEKSTKITGTYWNHDEVVDKVQQMNNAKIIDRPIKTLKHGQEACVASLDSEKEGMLTAKLSLIGEPYLKSRRVINVNNVGKYSGKWFVNRVVHKRGYNSIATLTRNSAYEKIQGKVKQDKESSINKQKQDDAALKKEMVTKPAMKFYKDMVKKAK